MGLPDYVTEERGLTPFESIVPVILRPALPGIRVVTMIDMEASMPFVLVRRMRKQSAWSGDPRGLDIGDIAIHTYTDGLNADEDGALLSDYIRRVLHDAWLRNHTEPGLGTLSYCRMYSAPRRVEDWATAAGPVQYAELPTQVERYETIYTIGISQPV